MANAAYAGRAALATGSIAAGVFLLLWLVPRPDPVPATAPPPVAGTFTGATVRTGRGSVKVAATLRTGRLVSVRVLLIPSGTRRDREIASYAVPRLTQEALAAQSAHIDPVSGAGCASRGYIASLRDALRRAASSTRRPPR